MGSGHSCSCKGKQKNGLGQPLGMDELMIVNPSRFGAEALFLGDDGMLYEVSSNDTEALQGPSQLFLGDDGSLYRIQGFVSGFDVADPPHQVGSYFLGADGTLYEVEGP